METAGRKYKRSNILILILLIAGASICDISAQNQQKADSGAKDNFYRSDSIFSFRSQKGYFPSLVSNFGEQATAPLHFKTKQWLLTGAAAGITTCLIFADDNINDWARIQKDQHVWVAEASPFVTKFGASYGTYSVAAFGLLSASFKNQKGVQTSLLASQAMITSGTWVTMIKILTGRERPITASPYPADGRWYGPFAQFNHDLTTRRPASSFNSFPSGHTATAFSIATVFAMRYKDKPAIPILCYSTASLVGLSRLTENRHWASDVFTGAVIGYLCGRQVVSHYNRTHQNPPQYTSYKYGFNPEITLIQSENQVGISVKW